MADDHTQILKSSSWTCLYCQEFVGFWKWWLKIEEDLSLFSGVGVFGDDRQKQTLVPLYMEYHGCPAMQHLSSGDLAVFFKILSSFHLYLDFWSVRSIFEVQKRMLFGMACLLVHVVYATVWSKTALQTLSWQLLGVAAEDHCPWCAIFCICDNQLSPLF